MPYSLQSPTQEKCVVSLLKPYSELPPNGSITCEFAIIGSPTDIEKFPIKFKLINLSPILETTLPHGDIGKDSFYGPWEINCGYYPKFCNMGAKYQFRFVGYAMPEETRKYIFEFEDQYGRSGKYIREQKFTAPYDYDCCSKKNN